MTVIQRTALTSALYIAAEALCLFAAAGRIDIPEFWIYLGCTVALFAGTIPTVDPDLAAERMRPGGKPMQPRMWGVIALLMGHFLVAGYDRGRLHAAGGVPVALEVLGFLLVATMWLVTLWAMQVNRFFSSAARLQPDRGQRVIDAGPYSVVRHPAYAVALLGCPANGLALGSWLAAAVGALAIPMLLWRCIAEDRMLRAGLPGYAAYAARVRWRLIPGIW
ncbi:MAG: isoprenylcysteine carboxylmethyltransferase family protein [Acetobacteraceae bacterium]|jgi:protein-S-isoprenylcysteine O-methyltransferase Ste14